MTKIEWTRNQDGSQGKTLDVTGGCTKCSVGCQNCWGIREVWRLAHNPLLGDKWQGLVEKTPSGLNWTGKIKLFPEMFERPLRRQKPTTYFVDSKADLFHKDVPFEFVTAVHSAIWRCHEHLFLLLTKRIKRAREYYLRPSTPELIRIAAQTRTGYFGRPPEWPLPNIHLGVSISTQDEADERIPILLQIPAAVRFVSVEPMLEPITLSVHRAVVEDIKRYIDDYLVGYKSVPCSDCTDWVQPKTNKIDWVIIGCESGPKRRECKIEWVQDLVEQCKAADVPVFVKQISLEGKVSHKPEEFPEWAKVRQMPKENRRCNLRLCTRRQNTQNRKSKGEKYKGVNMGGQLNKWQARITIKGKRTSLGYYKTKEEAARAYDKKAKELFGEFAHLNFEEK